MEVHDVLTELYGRLPDLVRDAVEGLEAEDLAQPPGDGSNPIGWLVWHLSRLQDEQTAQLFGGEQVWVSGDWASRFGLEPDPSDIGYGHQPDEVAAVRPDGPEVLTSYHDAVHGRLRSALTDLTPDDLDRVVDESWDPPVTLGVRLVSVADDSLQHAGQAAYVRGILGW